MIVKDRTEAILEAVKRAKESQFGVTAIKVELEANLDRGWDTGECHEFMMSRLAELGLATDDEGNDFYLSHEDYSTQWQPVKPLVYAETYNDGSVDTEFTFTILLDQPENILLLPKVIEIWNSMCAEAGDYVDVDGAGMHMAFLNNPSGEYPASRRGADFDRFDSFAKSMPLLLPALFFLGASNNESRGTDYRRPEIGRASHRSAIDWRQGALEFRLFDTCYNNPEQILDNFVVMTKCLRYWKSKFVPHGMDKITSRTSFGNNRGKDLSRFYVTHTHIDLLNKGLARLKPSYYTIKDIKQQRSFTKTKTKLNKERKEFAKQAEVEYAEYEERCDWQMKAIKSRTLGRLYDEAAANLRDRDEALLEREAEQRTVAEYGTRRSLSQYIRGRLAEYESSLTGSHTLRA